MVRVAPIDIHRQAATSTRARRQYIPAERLVQVKKTLRWRIDRGEVETKQRLAHLNAKARIVLPDRFKRNAANRVGVVRVF